MLKKQMVRIGTRGSKLALWQAEDLQSRLTEANVQSELVIIKTKGDQEQSLSLSKLEGKGFFTKEIEDALLDARIDVAVHSLKDLPTAMPEGLKLAGLSSRESPNDILLVRKESVDSEQTFGLSRHATVGTSSNRRKCLLRYYRPDLKLRDIRGNVPTRVNKLSQNEFDAIVLAEAGIKRLALDVSSFEWVSLNPREFAPAPGQAVIGYQIRAEDKELHKLIYSISDKQVVDAINVERKIMKLLDAGCHSPIGAHCIRDKNDFFHVYAAYAEKWTDEPVFVNHSSGTTFELAENIVDEIKERI